MEHHPQQEPMRGYHRDHAGDIIRIVDKCLAEEAVVLEGLMLRVMQNGGMDEQEMEARITAFHQAFKLDELA